MSGLYPGWIGVQHDAGCGRADDARKACSCGAPCDVLPFKDYSLAAESAAESLRNALAILGCLYARGGPRPFAIVSAADMEAITSRIERALQRLESKDAA